MKSKILLSALFLISSSQIAFATNTPTPDPSSTSSSTSSSTGGNSTSSAVGGNANSDSKSLSGALSGSTSKVGDVLATGVTGGLSSSASVEGSRSSSGGSSSSAGGGTGIGQGGAATNETKDSFNNDIVFEGDGRSINMSNLVANGCWGSVSGGGDTKRYFLGISWTKINWYCQAILNAQAVIDQHRDYVWARELKCGETKFLEADARRKSPKCWDNKTINQNPSKSSKTEPDN